MSDKERKKIVGRLRNLQTQIRKINRVIDFNNRYLKGGFNPFTPLNERREKILKEIIYLKNKLK